VDSVVKITKRPIKPEQVLADVRTADAGGTVSFMGTVRNQGELSSVTSMELEAASGLAKADLSRIVRVALREYDISKISVAHRVGKLRVGEIIVMIAVSAPHRTDAFKACKFVIDELKKSTPIWKKEYLGRKGRWVEGGR